MMLMMMKFGRRSKRRRWVRRKKKIQISKRRNEDAANKAIIKIKKKQLWEKFKWIYVNLWIEEIFRDTDDIEEKNRNFSNTERTAKRNQYAATRCDVWVSFGMIMRKSCNRADGTQGYLAGLHLVVYCQCFMYMI